MCIFLFLQKSDLIVESDKNDNDSFSPSSFGSNKKRENRSIAGLAKVR